MKARITLFIVMCFATCNLFAVAISRVEITEVTFYNFSQASYSIAGKQISVNSATYEVNNLTVSSGNVNVPAGGAVTLAGFSITDPTGSIALWHGGTFKVGATPTPADLIWFIQYGAAGQIHESIAVSAGIWSAGDFIPGPPPLIRDNDYSSNGISHWVSTFNVPELSFDEKIKIGPVPFSDKLTVYSAYPEYTLNISLYSVLGAEVRNIVAVKNSEIEVETADLPRGIYIIKISENGGNSVARRIMKH